MIILQTKKVQNCSHSISNSQWVDLQDAVGKGNSVRGVGGRRLELHLGTEGVGPVVETLPRIDSLNRRND